MLRLFELPSHSNHFGMISQRTNFLCEGRAPLNFGIHHMGFAFFSSNMNYLLDLCMRPTEGAFGFLLSFLLFSGSLFGCCFFVSWLLDPYLVVCSALVRTFELMFAPLWLGWLSFVWTRGEVFVGVGALL